MAGSYVTSFALTESVISEGGIWTSGGTPWNTVETTSGTPGHATGRNSSGSLDSYAFLTGRSIGVNHWVKGLVYHPGASNSAEVELHNRGVFIAGAPNQVKTYEHDFFPPNGIAIVRWNGPNNNVTVLTNVTNTQGDPVDGALIEAWCWGPFYNVSLRTIQNGVLIATAQDTDGSGLASGNPGMGFDAGAPADGDNYGLKGWSAGTIGEFEDPWASSKAHPGRGPGTGVGSGRFLRSNWPNPTLVAASQQFNQSLTGVLSFAGNRTVVVNVNKTAALSFVGLLKKLTATARAAALSFVGSLTTTKLFHAAFTAALSFVGAFGPTLTKHTMTAALSFSGAVTRSVTHLSTATLSFAGSLLKLTQTARTAALSFAGSLLTGSLFKQSLTGALSFVGSLGTSRVTLKALTAALSFSGALVKTTFTTKTATLSFVGSFAKRTSRVLTAAALSFSGAITRQTRKAQVAALTFAGALTTHASNQGTAFFMSFAAALGFVGHLAPPYSSFRAYLVNAQNRMLAIADQLRQRSIADQNRTDIVPPQNRSDQP